MHNWRWYDWLAVAAGWGALSLGLGVLVHGTTHSEELAVAAFFITIGGGPAVLYARRLLRLAREGPAPGQVPAEAVAERLNDLEARMAELEAVQARVWELEERLDFAERLLTQPGATPDSRPPIHNS